MAGADWFSARRPVQLRLARSPLWLFRRPERDSILPQFQHLAEGDTLEWGREYLTVAAVEPNRALVLRYEGHGMEWVWQFGLYPLDGDHTRLVSRGTERTPNSASFWVFMRVMEPASFVMTRKMLLTVKERAEKVHAAPLTGDHEAVAA